MNVLIEQNNDPLRGFNPVVEEDIQGFPITEIENLNNFERDLRNFNFKSKMVGLKTKIAGEYHFLFIFKGKKTITVWWKRY